MPVERLAPSWQDRNAPDGNTLERLASLEGVLLDLDGTLIDSVELIRTSLRHATEVVLGAALPDEVLMRNVGVPLRTQMQEFAPGRADELLVVYRAHNAEVHDRLLGEYPGTGAALDELLEMGLRLGVVTSKSRPVAERGLACCGLSEQIETLVAMEDTEKHKPDPEPLLLALERLGLSPDRCAYVGDAAQDMAAARAAGVLPVAALWGVHPPERVLADGAPVAVGSMDEFVSFVHRARR